MYWSLLEYFHTTVASSFSMYAGSEPLAAVTLKIVLSVLPVPVPAVFWITYTEPSSFVTAIMYSLPSCRLSVSTNRSIIVAEGSTRVVSSAFSCERTVNRFAGSSSYPRYFGLLGVELVAFVLFR